jgi:hypothetical protein
VARRMSQLLTGVAVIAMCLSLFAGRAASARPQAQSRAATASVGITGWGNVTLGKGFVQHRTVRCTASSCPSERYPINARRIVMIARPYKGWKFTGWHGACKGTSPKCVLDVRKRNARVGATFVAVGPGWTYQHPIRLGTTAGIGGGYQVRVNSILPNPQLSPAAPPGEAYFAANVTLTYTGPGEGDVGSIIWLTVAHQGDGFSSHSITAAGDPPYAAQQPTLDYHHPLSPGHSTPGYICWRVGANEATGIDEIAVTRSTLPYRDTFFTLR